jgi:hypothetical protein
VGGLGCLAGWRRGCNVNGRASRLDGLVDDGGSRSLVDGLGRGRGRLGLVCLVGALGHVDGVDNGLNDYVDILDFLVLVLTVGRMGESRASKSSNRESDSGTHLDGCCLFNLVGNRVWTEY